MTDRSVFEDVADALRGQTLPGGPELCCTYHRSGIKVWLAPAPKAPREHYEAQVIGPQYVPEATTLGIEVGFHCEHPQEADNEAVIAHLRKSERSWRRELGREASIGTFLGRENWRRISEVWPDPDLSDPELIFELAARITEYVSALEPHLAERRHGRR